MDLFQLYQEARENLNKIARDARWTMALKVSDYPITFVFKKDPYADPDSSEQLKGQQKLTGTIENADGEAIPEIRFFFKDEIELVTLIPDDQRIDAKFLDKLKKAAAEVHRLYLLYWFSEKEHRFERQWTPMFDVCDGKATVGILGKHYEP